MKLIRPVLMLILAQLLIQQLVAQAVLLARSQLTLVKILLLLSLPTALIIWPLVILMPLFRLTAHIT